MSVERWKAGKRSTLDGKTRQSWTRGPIGVRRTRSGPLEVFHVATGLPPIRHRAFLTLATATAAADAVLAIPGAWAMMVTLVGDDNPADLAMLASSDGVRIIAATKEILRGDKRPKEPENEEFP